MFEENNVALSEHEIYSETIADSLMDILLADRTTGMHIVWGTDDYAELGDAYAAEKEIKLPLISGIHKDIVQPRTKKAQKRQRERTREKAEIFTPAWICNAQNNLVDDAWFDRSHVFNKANEHDWESTKGKIHFDGTEGRTWQAYVSANRLEITCGEAPYLVSRYDTVSGEPIPIGQRIGMLDRKLRVVDENTETEAEWMEWAERAVQSIYGYELQGDNLLLARKNVLLTYIEYFRARFQKEPDPAVLEKIAVIISWNLWQMDGMNCSVPYCKLPPEVQQMGLFESMSPSEADGTGPTEKGYTLRLCKIMDWQLAQPVEFKSLMKGA